MNDATPAYLRIGKRRLRIPKRRSIRIALGIALVIRGVLPPAGFTRLMLMNAGAVFQHEELVQPDGEVLRGLQIFLRPSQGGLAPKVQFHDFGESVSHGAWRRVVGPEETAPLVVRSPTWIDDGRFSPGPVELPATPQHGVTRLLYVFVGEATVNGVLLHTGEAALLSGDASEMDVSEMSDLVLFSTDEESASFDRGMFSGNLFTAARS